jgi:hypothetical protein
MFIEKGLTGGEIRDDLHRALNPTLLGKGPREAQHRLARSLGDAVSSPRLLLLR